MLAAAIICSYMDLKVAVVADDELRDFSSLAFNPSVSIEIVVASIACGSRLLLCVS